MVKFIISKTHAGVPTLFFNVALGEWMPTAQEATRLHRIVAGEMAYAMRDQKGVKILPVMVDMR